MPHHGQDVFCSAFLIDLNVYLTGLVVLNGYLTGLLEDIFFHFLNLYAPATLLVHWSMLVFFMPLISYLHVVVVVACLFMLL